MWKGGKEIKMHRELKKFRKERGLEHEAGDVFGNTLLETGEVHKEIIKNNTLGIIEEFADHVIYAINGMEATGHDAKSNIERINKHDSQLLENPSPKAAVSCILIALANYNLEKDIKALALVAKISLNAIEALGFHAVACVTEKAKCINSRKGSHDKELGKWVKDSNQPKEEIYKPDYLSCKK